MTSVKVTQNTVVKHNDEPTAYVLMTLEVGDVVLEDVEATFGHLPNHGGWSLELDEAASDELFEMGIDDPDTAVGVALDESLGIDFGSEDFSQSYYDAALLSIYEFGHFNEKWTELVAEGRSHNVAVDVDMDEDGYMMADINFEFGGETHTIGAIPYNEAYDEIEMKEVRADLDNNPSTADFADEVKDNICAFIEAAHDADVRVSRERVVEPEMELGM